MSSKMISRRTFTQTLAAGAATLAISSTARSYAQIIGANNRLNFAVIGLRSRAYAHLDALKANKANARISHICDVESNTLAKFSSDAEKSVGYKPVSERDFRKILAVKDIDAITIATPDHWHAPMSILAVQAGKHVYVEKPCSYNPDEGRMLVEAQQKYRRLVQMGNQQRSSAHTQEIINRIRQGLIGRPYMANAWYVNHRGTIGTGKPVPVPATLDWDLWQGPAPRKPYHDNYQPYNWHWFKHWGTGETLNNGTHEVDICRWALGVGGFPTSVQATGGRYAYKDDWEFYDTLSVDFKYDNALLHWEGRSCNPMRIYDRERGSLILGTEGSVLIDRDGYEVYDAGGKKTSELKVSATRTSTTDTAGHDSMTSSHFANFIGAIRDGDRLRSPVNESYVPVTMLQLANISWETSRVLTLDPGSGSIVGDRAAAAMTKREYEKGWEPKLG